MNCVQTRPKRLFKQRTHHHFINTDSSLYTAGAFGNGRRVTNLEGGCHVGEVGNSSANDQHLACVKNAICEYSVCN